MKALPMGFVGIGSMGLPMARRLAQAGYQLTVHDTNPEALQSLADAGVRVAGSLRELADTAHTVFLSLPNGAIVDSVIQGSDGLLGGRQLKRIIDLSTIGPMAATRTAQAAQAQGVSYIDAPVSGGVGGAEAGTLAIMAACPTSQFDELRPVLEALGKPIHVGEQAGQAQLMKLANNLMSAAAIAITSEAMVMGAKGGLDAKTMIEVFNTSSGRNSATQDKFPKAVLTGTFDYGFSTGLAHKDVRLCLDEAEQLGVPMFLGTAVGQLLSATRSVYGAESDYTSLCRLVESWAGAEVRG